MARTLKELIGPILLLSILITFGLPVDASGVESTQDDLNLSAAASSVATEADASGRADRDRDDDDDWDDWESDRKDDDDDDAEDDWDDWDRDDEDSDAEEIDLHDDDDDGNNWRYDREWSSDSDDGDDEDWDDSWRYDNDEWKRDWDEEWDDAEDWEYRADNFPRRRRGSVEFRYSDNGYDRVWISGDFTDWHKESMRLDRAEDVWVIRLPLNSGSYYYRFEVEEDDDSWRVVDPSNSSQKKLGGRGWVSILDLEESGRVRNGTYSSRRRVRREFDSATAFLRIDDDEVFGTIGYQRVDGLFLGFGPEHVSTHGFEPSARGRIFYGFRSKEWSAGLTILQPLATRNRVWLKLDGYSGTDFNNPTGISGLENTIAAAFFHLDFRDYFKREGGSASLVYSGLPWLRVEGGIHVNDYESLENHARWSMTKGEFKLNPAIDEGTMRSAFGALRIGEKFNYVDLQYESSGEDIMGGDYHFERAVATFRTRIDLGRDQRLDCRLVGGANLNGCLPIQKRFVLGGLGTVRGYDYQSLLIPAESNPVPGVYGGELMAMGNLEYTFKLDGDLDLILLYDIGMVWEDRKADMDPEELVDAIGIGFLLDDGDLRINVVKPLDEEDDDPIVQVRMTRTF